MQSIQAIMAGSVWKILVKSGESVEAEQDLVILESMKMEVPIQSKTSGIVKLIHVAEGDFVNEGETLITIEEH